MKVIVKIYLLLAFLVFYTTKLVQSNLYIAFDIITPKMHSNPGYIKVPLRTNSKFGLLLFSNLVSMTPGTLSIDISANEKELLVHHLYDDKNKVLKDIEKIQTRIIKLTN
jgi:multisubunit Na+/H+ antiporter MnhE subunit